MDNKSKMSTVANAQTDDTWQPVKGTDELTALFSDTLLTAELGGGNELSLPLGIGIAKTSVIKGRPWKFQLQYWNYVETNDAFGPKHLVRLSISPVISAPWNEGR